MSSEESRNISDQDLQMVQNLIEQCLQHYMTLKEVANILSVQEKVEPVFTELVWKKLEQENQEFFKAYHLRLMLKEQIMEFNTLLGRQFEMMNRVDTAGVSFLPANGSHMPTMHQSTAFYAPEDMGPVLKRENMQHPITSNIPNDFSNCGVSAPSCMQTPINMPCHSRGTDITPNMLAHSSNLGISQVMNGGMIKTEAGYRNIPHFMYSPDVNVMETRPNGDPSISPFSNAEFNPQHLHQTLVDPDSSSFGILESLPQHFNLSSLGVDFPHETLPENYSGPPFTGRDSGNFLDSPGKGDNQEDARSMNTISDNLNFEDFCKD